MNVSSVIFDDSAEVVCGMCQWMLTAPDCNTCPVALTTRELIKRENEKK